MIAALCLQASLLLRPQYFGDAPPELRSARNILLIDSTSTQPGGSGLAPKEALAFAEKMRERILAGEAFEDVARDHSNHPNAAGGAVLGNFARGMLAPPLDDFLFAAEVGDVSQPLVTAGSVHLLQRIDTRAAVLQILVEGTGDESKSKAEKLQAELAGGADFAELAREHSADAASAERGGQYAIYERGTRDVLLKAAAFELEPGEVSQPVPTSFGYHLLKRVALDEVDPKLAESHWGRFSVILVAFRPPDEPDPEKGRSRTEAEVLMEEIRLKLAAGDAFAELAAELNDDPAAKARNGDLGWVYRFAPGMDRTFERAFLLPVGGLSSPLQTPQGLLLLRRDH